MLTLNQTAGSDKDLIWIIVIELDSTTLRFTYHYSGNITLSSNVYYGGRIESNSFYAPQKQVYLNGNQIGTVNNVSFNISKHSFYINDFYPATSDPYIIARNIKIGFVWAGATTEDQITWLETYYNEEYGIEANKITLFCAEESELEFQELPYYTIQKEYNDGVSYFTNAPKENYGNSLPIIYGSLLRLESVFGNRLEPIYSPLANCVMVDKDAYTYAVASHELYTADTTTELEQYVGTLDVKSILGGTLSNNKGVSKITLPENTTATLGIRPQQILDGSDITSITVGEDLPAYSGTRLFPSQTLKIGFNYGESAPELGAINQDTIIEVDTILDAMHPGNKVVVRIYDTFAGTNFGNDQRTGSGTFTKANLSFSISDWKTILNLGFEITADASNTGYVDVKDIILTVKGFYVKGIYNVLVGQKYTIPLHFFSIIPIGREERQRIIKEEREIELLDHNLYTSCRGRMFP